MKGYFLKLLKVDVTNKTFSKEPVDKKLLAATIGGKGFAIKLLLDNNPAGIDPFDPENHLILATGPLTGSSLFGASRYKENTRRFNIREGLTIQDDTLPPGLLDNKLENKSSINRDELEKLVLDYYKIRGWDEKGVPRAYKDN